VAGKARGLAGDRGGRGHRDHAAAVRVPAGFDHVGAQVLSTNLDPGFLGGDDGAPNDVHLHGVSTTDNDSISGHRGAVYSNDHTRLPLEACTLAHNTGADVYLRDTAEATLIVKATAPSRQPCGIRSLPENNPAVF